jgi:hypothetical protein
MAGALEQGAEEPMAVGDIDHITVRFLESDGIHIQ